jgi:glyoxalase family protein
VHHVAFRAADDAEQQSRHQEMLRLGVAVTDVRDRNYFRSIYFREPGGVLYEIATDGPGFTIDETPAELGTSLKLPPRLESLRARLEVSLPPLRLPHAEAFEG